MMSKGRKILVVDDEASVRKLVSSYLSREGYQVLESADGEDALKIARTQHPDLIVLDLMIPSMDGLEVCRILRSEMDIFIIMLTARIEETDKLLGLGLGADDYLTKPFSPRELVARVKAVLRRGRAPLASTQTILRAGAIEIDPERHLATAEGRVLDLTAREFDIISQLASRPGMVFTREKLLELVWGYDFYGDPRVVDVHVAKLRKKLEADSSRPKYIQTVRGVGYKLETGEE